ncbi:Cof-type HAD-IIB family hydrolase [Bacillus thuringiensis]|uniref:Cof-type HAD-IIB family hydrolase n=1 Tax=Bacillus thuringiensis TaxID=1428 RepID=UPI0021D685D4|nr:Cof-type HAD-IIB family hydrolase [Bacillus thuringiensis]MCU7667797.1 Cof-type HAD-IIB family hydrolase [Bacillus thuringiensis]
MKLIAIDLDGTLLSSNHEISDININALKKAQEQGHVVAICSGRAPESIHGLLQTYKLDCPIAASNGTVVKVDEKVIGMTSIEKEKVANISEILNREQFPFRIYTNDGIYIPKNWESRLENVLNEPGIPDEYRKHQHFERMLEHPQGLVDGIKTFEDIHVLLDDESLLVQKFFVLTINPEKKTKLNNLLNEVEQIGVTSSAPFNIEVMNMDGHKGIGLRTLADYFNIPMEDTVAIGDNFNDVPMFEAAGLAIAMGNAEEDVKKVCDVTTSSNNEHGVAHAFETYILK